MSRYGRGTFLYVKKTGIECVFHAMFQIFPFFCVSFSALASLQSGASVVIPSDNKPLRSKLRQSCGKGPYYELTPVIRAERTSHHIYLLVMIKSSVM